MTTRKKYPKEFKLDAIKCPALWYTFSTLMVALVVHHPRLQITLNQL